MNNKQIEAAIDKVEGDTTIKPLFKLAPGVAFKIYDALLANPEIKTQVRDLFTTASNFHRLIDDNLEEPL